MRAPRRPDAGKATEDQPRPYEFTERSGLCAFERTSLCVRPQDIWIFQTSNGDTAYERPDGTYYLKRADGSTKAVTEFEIRRFVSSLRDQKLIDDAVSKIEKTLEAQLGIKMPENVRKAVIEKATKEARAQGLIKSTSVASGILD